MVFAVVSVTLVTVMNTLCFAAATTTTYHSTDVPKGIIDGGTITSVIVVPPPFCSETKSISDINVQLDITHSYDWDLEIFLIAPNGTRIELSTNNGDLGDNYSGTVFDDEAVETIIDGLPPFAGTYQPEGFLGVVDGDGTSGTWTLEIRDFFPGDTGMLNSWSLIIETIDDATYHSANTPIAINDNATVTSTLPICNTAKITDVNVQLDITHTWDSDLDIFLIAPDGTRIELTTDNGGSGHDYSGTIFDDEATTAIIDGIPPFEGAYQPEGTLAVLNGSVAEGIWTLEIGDDELEFWGTLNSWSLTIKTIAAPYKISTYVSGLPSEPAGLTVDQCSRKSNGVTTTGN